MGCKERYVRSFKCSDKNWHRRHHLWPLSYHYFEFYFLYNNLFFLLFYHVLVFYTYYFIILFYYVLCSYVIVKFLLDEDLNFICIIELHFLFYIYYSICMHNLVKRSINILWMFSIQSCCREEHVPHSESI